MHKTSASNRESFLPNVRETVYYLHSKSIGNLETHLSRKRKCKVQPHSAALKLIYSLIPSRKREEKHPSSCQRKTSWNKELFIPVGSPIFLFHDKELRTIYRDKLYENSRLNPLSLSVWCSFESTFKLNGHHVSREQNHSSCFNMAMK